MIEIVDVSFKYDEGKEVLNKVNLSIDKGEIVAIMGENGAGKTTLAKHLNGLLKPHTGNVLINSKNTSDFSVAELSKEVGFVFQNPNHSIFSTSVKEEIMFTLKNYDFSDEEIEKRLEEIIKLFSLEKYLDKSPFTLSGGEQKRVSIASVLCLNPDIIILDEPTTGQDAKQKKVIMKTIREYSNQGKTVILISHDTEFVVEVVDRIIVMAEGEIIADGETTKILSNEKILEMSNLKLPILNEFCKEIAKKTTFPQDLVKYQEVLNAINKINGGK
ncbi:MAG: energy-coupling factor ABC transporter ATP-binding protein [Candidatus Ranarchaeia archaeon]